MNELRIVEPEIQDLQVSSGDMLGKAALLSVVDDSTCLRGSELLLEINRRMKSVEERFKEPCDAAFKAHRSLTALRDSVLSPFKQALGTIDGKIKLYRAEVRRKREQEEAEARRAAEAKAEAERLAKAEQQMDKGDLQGCQKTLETPLPPPIVRVETAEAPKIAGLSYRDEWFFEITDPDAVPREYCTPDPKKLRAVVKGLGKAAASIKGIRVWSEEVSSKRASVA